MPVWVRVPPSVQIYLKDDVFLSFHLDHINGDNTDNRIENLKILCPNCHSQTPTYCKSKKKINKVK